jgi:cytochrome P450
MMQLALGIVSKTLLDVDAGDRYSEVASAIEVILNDFDERFRSAFPPPFWLPLVPRNRRLKEAVRRLDTIIETIIGQRRAERGDRGDLLSLLVEARDEEDATGMTDRQLRDEVMTMFLAGHETTANALAWTWSLLATHPAIADRLREELASVLDGRSPTAGDVPNLVYTGQILQEALRLYPPAYTFGREATEDVDLGGYRIRKGTTILISQWVMHRDPRFFDRPDEFDPDRWSNVRGKNIPRYAYFPFGGGPRTCVGNSFAMLEATLVLATIAARFQMTLAPGALIAPRASVTLRPQNGVRCVIHRRDAGGMAVTGHAARPVRTGT